MIERLGARERRILAVAILGLLLLAAGALLWLPFAYAARQDATLDGLRRHVADLRARLPAREELLEQQALLERSGSLDDALLNGSTPAIAAAQLQGDLTALAAAMGGEVTTVQIIEPEPAPPFVRIGLRLSLVGDTATVRDFLYAVETRDPVLTVLAMSLTVRSSGADVAANPELSATFEIAGYAPSTILR